MHITVAEKRLILSKYRFTRLSIKKFMKNKLYFDHLISLMFAFFPKDLPIKINAMLVKEIINPGGISHHQYPRISADAACASCSICPQVGKLGSPNPRKLNEDSYNIAAGTANAKLAKVKGNN